MKYFLGVLGVLLVLILVLVLVFRGGDDQGATTSQVKKLTDYATDTNTEAVYTAAGAINAEENHRIIQITVTANGREVAILDGYNGKTQDSKTFSNTTAAFEAFLAALEQLGFTNKRDTRLDFTSVCPTGTRYSYELATSTETVVDAWSASCEKGSYAGKAAQTRRLFEAQIPEYSEFVSDVNFSL